MNYALAPGHSFGVADGHAIVLDLERDRYYRLSAALTKILIGVGNGTENLNDADVEPLKRCGVLMEGSGGATPVPVTVLPPALSAIEIGSSRSFSTTGGLSVARSVLATRFCLAFRGFAASIAHARQIYRSSESRPDPAAAVAVAQVYARARPHIPIARACVLDSLSLSALLSRSGIAHDVLLGVRVSPFAAHAWVQTVDHVLSDKLDPILELTPVFRL